MWGESKDCNANKVLNPLSFFYLSFIVYMYIVIKRSLQIKEKNVTFVTFFLKASLSNISKISW